MKNAPAVEPGRGNEVSTKDRPSPTPLDPNRQHIDLRLAFLACAAARFDLVEAGAMTLDEAVDDLFIENFRAVAGIVCHCEFEIMQRIEAEHRRTREQQLQEWRWSRPPREQCRPAASTLAAYQYVLRLNDPEKLRAWLERHPEIKP
jgi:hypothetical protein